MKYHLISKGELIGYSELEGRDPSMGVASGKFYPYEGYAKVKGVFQKRSELLIADYYDGVLEGRERYEQMDAQIGDLELHLRADSGETVRTRHISLDDFSDESTEEYQLSIVVEERGTYERFFQ